MKRRRPLRESRLVHAAVGASILVIPASTVALADTAPHTTAKSGTTGTGSGIQAKVRTRRVPYGRDVVVTGRAPAGDAGQQLALQYAPNGSGGAWRQVAGTTVRPDGRFRLTAALSRSGLVRVSGGSPSGASSSTTAPLALAADSNSASTTPQRVAVAAVLRVPRRAINVLGSDVVTLRGKLLPGAAHRRVELQVLRAGRWATVAVARTGPRGGFHFRYGAGGLGRQRLRVRFPGDIANAAANHGAGTLTVYHQTMASWYDDGGSTACGFHAYYGVANLSLPCGTQVNFVSGGRTVTAVVDDRGPYVGGRTWDLNQNLAGALGVSGVSAVWSSS